MEIVQLLVNALHHLTQTFIGALGGTVIVDSTGSGGHTPLDGNDMVATADIKVQ
jgi:hypothetical protein